VSSERDYLGRLAAFQYLDRLTDAYGDPLPWSALTHGFSYQGIAIPLLGAAGIWKPRALDLPISISTSPRNPYGDTTGDDGLLRYRYQGSSARSYDNVLPSDGRIETPHLLPRCRQGLLRRAMASGGGG
jgi:hypothetical protein